MTILVITNKTDVHADSVIELLAELRPRRRIVRLNTEDFSNNVRLHLYDGASGSEISLKDSGLNFSPDEINTVWYRKPAPIAPPVGMEQEDAKQFVIREAEQTLLSLYGLLSDRFWVSEPTRIERASDKLLNLKLAKKAGLLTPRTMVTNELSAARSFAKDLSWNIVAKAFRANAFKYFEHDDVSWMSYTSRLDESTFQAIEKSIEFAPVILQEYIEKKIELRVTVIGEDVFCASIDSQSQPDSRDDWRAGDVNTLEHRPFELPRDVVESLLKFNSHFGLNFSTFDLILTKENKYIWLECNPNGQWLWIETKTGQELSKAMANLLFHNSSRAR